MDKNNNKLTHIDSNGNAVMVDVGDKDVTTRIATASGQISMTPEAFSAIISGSSKKGDVLSVAQIAGIMATKRTSDLIPLCHNINLQKSTIDFITIPQNNSVKAVCTVKCQGKTGVEMEALTGVSVALLTIYDMCKAIDKSMMIKDIMLEEKLGGKSGHYLAETR